LAARVERGLVPEVRTRGIAAFAEGHHGPRPRLRPELDDADVRVAVDAVASLPRDRSPPGRMVSLPSIRGFEFPVVRIYAVRTSFESVRDC
jgi:hypothetical protein